jgi:hypothetical protein
MSEDAEGTSETARLGEEGESADESDAERVLFLVLTSPCTVDVDVDGGDGAGDRRPFMGDCLRL